MSELEGWPDIDPDEESQLLEVYGEYEQSSKSRIDPNQLMSCAKQLFAPSSQEGFSSQGEPPSSQPNDLIGENSSFNELDVSYPAESNTENVVAVEVPDGLMDLDDNDSNYATSDDDDVVVPSHIDDDIHSWVYRGRDQESMKYPPIGDSISFTNPENGQRLYLRIQDDEKEEPLKHRIRQYCRNGESSQASRNSYIEGLLTKVSAEKAIKLISEQDEEIDSSESNTLSNGHVNGELWVQKYHPSAFKDLLSDTKTNREVLGWLKSWDPKVFHKTPRKNTTALKNETIPPIVLLVGDPGCGKTTLAHVVAAHCGYRPMEVNASDERSGKKMKLLLENSTEMKLSFLNQKPNCIILDEIDGATGGDEQSAISELLSIAKSKKGLQKPVICIANDLFAKCLKPLRFSDLCSVHHFSKPNSKTLVDFLYNVCQEENLRTDKSTLGKLAHQCNNDIRCCLNTLEFISKQNHIERLTADVYDKLPFGQKDMEDGFFDTWGMIFQSPSSSEDVNPLYFDTFVKKVSSSSDSNKMILEGVFENYLLRKFSDPTLDKTLKTIEWMEFSQSIEHHIASKQMYQLTPYIPISSFAAHIWCSSKHNHPLRFPKDAFSHTTQHRHNISVLDDFALVSPVYRNLGLTNSVCILQFLPLARIILTSPTKLRNKVFRNLSEDDKLFMRRMVELFQSLGLSIVPNAQHKIIPNVFPIISFQGLPLHPVISEEFKQLLYVELHRPPSTSDTVNNSTGMEPAKKTGKSTGTFKFGSKSGGRRKRNRVVYPVRFKYNEGVTNAIRRPLLMKELLIDGLKD